MKRSVKTVLNDGRGNVYSFYVLMCCSFILLCDYFSLEFLLYNFVNTQETETCFIFRIALGPAQ